MEMFFLACFVFGVLFTGVSLLLGFVNGGAGDAGSGADLPAVDAADLGGAALHPASDPVAGAPSLDASHGHAAIDWLHGLPVFNFSTLLAALTWFGATGYVLHGLLGWTTAPATLAAIAIGCLGGALVAWFLKQVRSGERVMHARDYRVEGTLARVTISIPESGVGEIIYDLAGSRRSEAARSLNGQAIPRDTEVVVLRYEHGVAAVEPYAALVGEGVATSDSGPPARA